MNTITKQNVKANLENYENSYRGFNWENFKPDFSWNETNQINMAYECADRHVAAGKGNKTALHYYDGIRNETYSYSELSDNSNKIANKLKQDVKTEKGDRALIFMP